jgi:hypothetical protein
VIVVERALGIVPGISKNTNTIFAVENVTIIIVLVKD